VCLSGKRHVLETHGTPLHSKQINPDKLVWAMAALAEGLGLRAVARVFETDPNTVLNWLVEAAEHLEAFSHHVVHDLEVEQVQRDELFALLSAVKDGEVSERQAIKRLSRSPQWLWVAMDPVGKLILAVDVGDHTMAMAQRLVHQVTQGLVVAAIGRRVNTLCKHEAGLRQQLTLFHVYHNFVLPPTPACVCPWLSWSRYPVRVPPSAGSRGHRRWPRG
jgi:hypothetical protein